MNQQHWYCEACGKTGWFPTDDNADVLIVMDASLNVHALSSPDCYKPWAVHLGTPPVESDAIDGLQYALDVAICALQEIMNEAACLSDLLEKGMAKMDELGLKQARGTLFVFDSANQPVSCCAVGAMLLGAGIEPRLETAPRTTEDALRILHEGCPQISSFTDRLLPISGKTLTVGDCIWRMNDGRQTMTAGQWSLPEILAWLKSQGL